MYPGCKGPASNGGGNSLTNLFSRFTRLATAASTPMTARWWGRAPAAFIPAPTPGPAESGGPDGSAAGAGESGANTPSARPPGVGYRRDDGANMPSTARTAHDWGSESIRHSSFDLDPSGVPSSNH